MKLSGIILLIIASLFAMNVQAQGSKVGHINTSDLIKIMPDYATAKTTLEKIQAEFESQLDLLLEEYQKKVEYYKSLPESTNALIKKDLEYEILQLEDRIKKFQEDAQVELDSQEKLLIAPILEKVQTAIKEVAKERGYDYIFDTSSGIVLYFKDTEDITIYVKKKLGIN